MILLLIILLPLYILCNLSPGWHCCNNIVLALTQMLQFKILLLGSVPRKMVKFKPGLCQILSKLFLSKNM